MRIAVATGLLLMAGAANAIQTWRMDAQGSRLGFVAKQAGAEFEGRFDKFAADIRFDPKDLPGSRFDVTIELGATNTQDEERDGILKGPELFWVGRYPQARYVTDSFTSLGGSRYSAQGKLTLRGVTAQVPITFTLKSDGKGSRLEGSGNIKRLQFGVGKGEWASTDSVADNVLVKFSLLLQP